MHAIELNNISFSYGRRRILENLSFTVAPGECAVLAGPNGSGKSTALSLMAGVLRPDSGCIYIQGVTGFAPQGTALFEDMTAEENLRFFAKLKKCPFPETLPFSVKKHLNTRVSRLSGGTKKQVSIACALLGEPDIILLDEPCESLDVGFREELCGMVSSLKAQGRAFSFDVKTLADCTAPRDLRARSLVMGAAAILLFVVLFGFCTDAVDRSFRPMLPALGMKAGLTAVLLPETLLSAAAAALFGGAGMALAGFPELMPAVAVYCVMLCAAALCLLALLPSAKSVHVLLPLLVIASAALCPLYVDAALYSPALGLLRNFLPPWWLWLISDAPLLWGLAAALLLAAGFLLMILRGRLFGKYRFR